MKSVVAELDGGTAKGAKDPITEATLLVMMDYWSRRGLNNVPGQQGDRANDRYRPVDQWLTSRWVHAGGLPFALDVIAAFPTLTTDSSLAGTAATHTLTVTRGEGRWWCLEVGHLGLLHSLRRWVVAADDVAYENVRTHATTQREHATPWMRAALSFIFPDELAWAKADLALATPKSAKARLPPFTWGLVTTRLEGPPLVRILESMAKDDQPWVTESERYGFSLADRLGDDSAPLLVGYLDLARTASAKAAFAEALALTDHPEARAYFERNVKHKTLGKLAVAYLGSR
jgi:hypothetical protein